MSFSLNESELKVAIVVAILTIMATVGVLHVKGYIKHSNPVDAATVDTFKLLSLKPGYEQIVSAKDSGKLAFCADGYLLVRSKIKDTTGGILVDEKHRAIECKMQNFHGTAPEAQASGTP